MAAGKSTVGRTLAARLGLPFLDTDDEIEAAFGLSVADIFAQRGEGAFRTAERELILRLLGGEARVLSLGGGAYADRETREALNERATTVWLDPPFELILERMARSSKRPLVAASPAAELRQLWRARRESYAQAHIHVVTSEADPATAVERILNQLG